MPENGNNTTILGGKKLTLLMEGVKFVVYIGTILVATMVFFWRSQADQDGKIANNTTRVQTVETRHQEHVQQAAETFRNLDRTMTEQRQVIQSTRETLSRLDATQEGLREQNGRLAEEVRRLADEVRRSATVPR